MAKKVNVSSLMNSAMNDDIDAAETVKKLKAQRNKENFTIKNQVKSEDNSYSKVVTESPRTDSKHENVTREHPKIMELEHLLGQENFSDRKEQFIFRLSQQCFDDYEELTRTVNYKLHKKLSRNDIMRKVLEQYHTTELEELLKVLHTI